MPSMSEGLAEASSPVVAEPKPNLERGLGTLDATMIGIGSMIGSGIFIVSAYVTQAMGAPGWLILAWGLAGLLTILGSPCAGEVAAMYPRAGGQYVFLREAYGPSIGFVFGWSTLLVIQTGTIAAVAVAFARFLGVFLSQVSDKVYLFGPKHLGDHYAVSLTTQQGVAILIILGLTWMNTRGLRAGKIVMNIFTFTKTAALIALIVLGIGFGLIHAGNHAAAAWSSSWWDSSANGWSLSAGAKAAEVTLPAAGIFGFLMLFGKAMVGPLFSQTGWNGVTFTGGEVRNPGKTLPRALLIGCGTVVLLYLLANAAYVLTLSLDEIQNAPNARVGTATMEKIFPSIGAQIMAVAIMVSTFGCINGLILSGGRVYYAMARDGLFFRRAGLTNSRHVPAFALITQGIWSAILVLPLTIKGLKPGTNLHEYGNLYGQLLDYIVPVDLLFYSLMVGSVIVFRLKRPDAERPYRAIGYPVTPLIYIGLAALLVANFIYLSPKVSGIGFLIALTGLPVYFVWSRFSRKAAEDTAIL
jgi:basic amino acid/polyamine antiporter, APA family